MMIICFLRSWGGIGKSLGMDLLGCKSSGLDGVRLSHWNAKQKRKSRIVVVKVGLMMIFAV